MVENNDDGTFQIYWFDLDIMENGTGESKEVDIVFTTTCGTIGTIYKKTSQRLSVVNPCFRPEYA